MTTTALCISDLTSEETCREYLLKFLQKHRPQLIILAGDITQNGPVDYAEDILEICEKRKLPVVSVHGNNDPKRIQELLAQRTVYVHARRAEVLGFEFAGAGGSGPTPFNTVCEYTHEQITSFFKGNVNSNTIVVSHAGPRGVLDISKHQGEHAGSLAVREMVDRDQPRAVVCGHIHEQEGEGMLGKTKIVKVAALMYGKAALLELETLKTTFVQA